MGKLDEAVRGEMIKIIQEQAPMGLTLFTNATTPLMIAIEKEADDKASAKEDMFALIVDCAFCLIPVGKVLGKLVGNLSKMGSRKISKEAMKEIIAKTAEGVAPEVVKEATKFVSKEIGNSVLDILDPGVQVDFKLINQMTDTFKGHIDNLLDLIRDKESDYDSLPDNLLSTLYARWDPNNNKPWLYESLVTQTFTEIKRINSSLGYKSSGGTYSMETVGKVAFNILDHSPTWYDPSGNASAEQWVKGIPVLVVTTSNLEVTDDQGRKKLEKVKRTSISQIPGPLRFYAMTLAYDGGNVMNDPFVFEQPDWLDGITTAMNQLVNWGDESTIYLKINPQGKYSTKTIFGFAYPLAKRFNIEPSLVGKVEN